MYAMNTEEAFKFIRPYCVRVIEVHSVEVVKLLLDVLVKTQFSESSIQDLQEYLTYPLVLLLKRFSSNENLMIACLTCLDNVLARSCIDKPEICSDVFNTILTVVAPPKSNKEGSDELKISGVRAVGSLVTRCGLSCTIMLMTSSLPLTGAFISSLLKFAQQKTCCDLQSLSLTCLLSLLQSREDMIVKQRLEAAAPGLLPGVALAMRQIITDDKQNSAIIKKALECMKTIVTVTLCDSVCSDLSNAAPRNPNADNKLKSLLIERTDKWLDMTTQNVHILLTHITKASLYHSKYSVRLELTELAYSLLVNCHGTLHNSCALLLDVLVGHCGDPYPEVSTPSLKYLSLCTEILPEAAVILEDRIYELATQLPRLLRTKDEKECLSTLQLFSGYITALDSKITQLFNSFSHMTRVNSALIQLVEVDSSHVNIMDTVLRDSNDVVPDSPTHVFPVCRRVFTGFHDIKIWQQVQKICHQIASVAPTYKLIDYFLSTFQSDPAHQPQCCLIVNEILTYHVTQVVKVLAMDLLQACTSVLDIYTAHYHKLANHITDDRPGALRNATTQLTCLLLEGIVFVHQITGSTQPELLLSSLYIIMESCGNSNPAISQTALSGLIFISQAFKYSGPAELLEKHSNYLGNIISLNVRRLNKHPTCPAVLQTLLQHCKSTILIHIDYIIIEMLLSVDTASHENTLSLLRPLQTLLTRMVVWNLSSIEQVQKDKQEMEAESPSTPLFSEMTVDQKVQAVTRYIKGYLAAKKEMKMFESNNVNVPVNEATEDVSQEADSGMSQEGDGGVSPQQEESENEPTNQKLPLHVDLTKQIMERCRHLVSHEHPKVRLVVLDMLSNGYRILSNHNREFLPCVHDTWNGLSGRFSDAEPLVVLSTHSVLSLLTILAKGFIRVRVCRDVLPRLQTRLVASAANSKNSAPAYKHTLEYKLQLKLLRSLGDMVKELKVSPEAIERIVRCCLPYLSSSQPTELVKVGIESMTVISSVDPSCVQYYLLTLHKEESYSNSIQLLGSVISKLSAPSMEL